MKHFLVFIIALFAYTANAQTGITVTGRVTDDAGNAIERATVTMTRLDDGTKLAPVITGNDGTFMIDSISEGRYTLGITCVGYDKYNKKTARKRPSRFGRGRYGRFCKNARRSDGHGGLLEREVKRHHNGQGERQSAG